MEASALPPLMAVAERPLTVTVWASRADVPIDSKSCGSLKVTTQGVEALPVPVTVETVPGPVTDATAAFIASVVTVASSRIPEDLP